MKLEFKNKEVADNFEPVFSKDKRITIQGLYAGMLSAITPDVAEKLIELGDNQLKRKGATPAAKEKLTVVPPKDK